jgi:hypothetical protein
MLWILPVVLSACSAANPPSQAEVEKFLAQYVGEPDVSKGMALISREPTVSSIAYGKINQAGKQFAQPMKRLLVRPSKPLSALSM